MCTAVRVNSGQQNPNFPQQYFPGTHPVSILLLFLSSQKSITERFLPASRGRGLGEGEAKITRLRSKHSAAQ